MNFDANIAIYRRAAKFRCQFAADADSALKPARNSAAGRLAKIASKPLISSDLWVSEGRFLGITSRFFPAGSEMRRGRRPSHAVARRRVHHGVIGKIGGIILAALDRSRLCSA